MVVFSINHFKRIEKYILMLHYYDELEVSTFLGCFAVSDIQGI